MLYDKQPGGTGVATSLPTNPTYPYNTPNLSVRENMFVSNKPAGLSLIEAIVEENSLFKHQQTNIRQELAKLKTISDSLLKENVQLRHLYRERTHDISKLMSTLGINTQEMTNDYLHQEFLIKELNCGLLKHIKLAMKDKEDVESQIEEKKEEVMKLSEDKTAIEQEVVNRLRIKLKNTLNPRIIAQCENKQKQEGKKLSILMEEVNSLLTDNKELKYTIRNYKGSSSMTQQSLSLEKGELQNKISYLQIQIERYRQEVLNDKNVYDHIYNVCTNKLDKYNKSRQELFEVMKKYEELQRNNQEFNMERQAIRERINESKQKCEKNTNTFKEVCDKKEELVAKIKAIKDKMKTQKEGKETKLQQFNNANKENIRAVRNTIAKNSTTGESEIAKTREQINSVYNLISSYDIECGHLQDQIEEYKSVLKGLNNPVSEIEKLQLMARLKKVR